jgi:hypothetical protein
MLVVLGPGRRWSVRDSTSFLNAGEDRDLRFGRGSLRRLQESGLVVVEPGIARCLLGLFGKGSDGLRAADFLSGDAEVASRKAVAASMAMTATVFPPAFILRNLPRLNVTPLLREFCVFGHLLGSLANRQLSAKQVLGDRPHPGFEIVEVDEPHEDALHVKHLERFDAVSAGDEHEAPLPLDHSGRALQADRGDGPRQINDGRRVVRARYRRNFYLAQPEC